MELCKAFEALYLLHRAPSPLLLHCRIHAIPHHSRTLTSPRRFTTTRQIRAEDKATDKAAFDISRLLDDSLGPAAPARRPFNPTYGSTSSPSASSTSSRLRQPPIGSTTDDLLDAMKGTLTRQTQPRRTSDMTIRDDIGGYLDPLSRTTAPSLSPGQLPSSFGSSTSITPEAVPLSIKLGPTVGRTVIVDGRRMDIGRAFRSLEIQCARNSVRKDSMAQRFHERPGLKRKRLKSERWRRRFREGFKAVVARVQVMRKQGW